MKLPTALLAIFTLTLPLISASTRGPAPMPEIRPSLPTASIPTMAPTTTKPTTTTSPPLKDVTYWVSFSKRIRPGAPLAVNVFAPNASGPFTLGLSLMDVNGRELQKGQNFSLQASDKIQTVQFPISSGLSGWSFYIRAQAWEGEEFDGFERVFLTNKRLSVFIQTDKAMYLPGQTVRFRALVMQPDLKIMNTPMDVVITDPHNNRIAQWLNVSSDDDTGVLQGDMVTSLFPPLGTWTIRATADGVTEVKNFKLQEYELPQFEVKLNFPSYSLTTDESVVGKINAKYTFGSPVQGSGQVVATYQYYSSFQSKTKSIVKEFTMNSDGEGEVEFSVEELKDLAYNTTVSNSPWWRSPRSQFSIDYRSFNFNASVTDAVTDDVMTEQTSLTFYGRSMMLRFMPITPSAYKPGLPVNVYVEALQPNGNQPLAETEGVSVTFNVTYHVPMTVQPIGGPDSPRLSWWFWPRTQQKNLLAKEVSLDENGVAKLKIDTDSIPKDARFIQVHAESGKVFTSRTLNPFVSPSNAFMQLSLKTSTPKAGKRVTVQAKSNVKFGDYTLQVYSKSMLVLSKNYQVEDMRSKRNIKFTLTSAMTPVADVIVFFTTETGEIVVDKLSVAVDDVSANEVSLEFVDDEVKPGQNAKLKVMATPRSKVFLLGVDKSVRLLGTGNDISRSDVMSELFQYGSGNSYLFRGSWFFYDYSRDADDVFRGANAGIITDATIPGKYMDIPAPFRKLFPTPAPSTMAPGVRPVPMAMNMMEGPDAPNAPQQRLFASPEAAVDSGAPARGGGRQEETPAERLRTFFPETWLWDTVSMKNKRKEVVKMKTPDTITTWVVTAFAVHPTLGLSVSDTPAEVLAIKRLFVTLDLPYSAVRGEDVCFTALTFNRYDEPVNVSITLAENSTAFQNVLIENKRNKVVEKLESKRIRQSLGEIQPNAMQSTTFCLKPHTLGDMPITVTLDANKPADGLMKTFRIKPEGVERSQTYPVLIEIPEGKKMREFAKTVKVQLPEDVVKGSVRMSVSIVGDVMGVVAENLEDLLRMPYGCGEQNMVNFAPNTYLISYLNETGRLTPAILTKAKSFMVSGYQRQLQYQHDEGGFSAFGNRDKSASMWLTAFVVKCFVQAADLGTDIIIIEPSVISQAVMWMTRFQNKDGSFREPGQVFHDAMQGGSAEGIALTAYVTMTLKEAQNRFSPKMSQGQKLLLNQALNRAVSYLEDELPEISDTYTACIVAYALTLTGSEKAEGARKLMQQRATTGDTMKYWAGPPDVKETRYPWYRKADALSIEMTSYALLTMMQKNMLAEAIPVFRWLNNQRGPKGGFISTQDTVLGIEALATMAELALGDSFSPIEIEVATCATSTSERASRTLTVDEKSVLLLQKVDIPLKNDDYPSRVTVIAKSGGTSRVFALAEVVVYYNMDTSTADQTFFAETTITNNTAKSFILTTCVRRNSDIDSQSMVLTEIGVPSGYEVVRKQSNFGNSSSVDFTEERVILYYSSLSSKDECSVIKMKMTKGVVANTKPAPVRVYDYYDPDDEFTTSYSLKPFGVCDLEPDYMACASLRK